MAAIIREFKPDRIINAAAYTAVDKAESEEHIANIINGETVGVIAAEAKKINAHLLHYSTDYVFDGSKQAPYSETDPTGPINAYGRSKLLGESLIQQVGGQFVILRVSWVYGFRAANFYRTMLRLAADRESIGVVDDQVGAPTWCRHIADASSHLISDSLLQEKSGIYHLSPQGETSWYGFAEKIFEFNRDCHSEQSLKIQTLNKLTSKEYVTPAARLLNSRMRALKIKEQFGIQLPHWQISLEMVIADSLNSLIQS